MRKLIWSAAAQRELRAIIAYYEQFDSDLPDRLIDRIDAAARKLLDFPNMGPAVANTRSRSWQAKGTPFLLVYTPTREGVRVLKVRHGASDWKPRT